MINGPTLKVSAHADRRNTMKKLLVLTMLSALPAWAIDLNTATVAI